MIVQNSKKLRLNMSRYSLHRKIAYKKKKKINNIPILLRYQADLYASTTERIKRQSLMYRLATIFG